MTSPLRVGADTHLRRVTVLSDTPAGLEGCGSAGEGKGAACMSPH